MMSGQEGLGFSTLSLWGKCWNLDAPCVPNPLLDFADFNNHFPFLDFLSDTESDRCQLGRSSRGHLFHPLNTLTGT